MFEGEHYARTTVRNFQIVGNVGPVASSVVKDCLTSGTHRRRRVSMAEWSDKLDAFLSFNERDVLSHAGRLRMDVAQKLAAERFEVFGANRRAAEALAADEADFTQLEQMERAAKERKKGGRDA